MNKISNAIAMIGLETQLDTARSIIGDALNDRAVAALELRRQAIAKDYFTPRGNADEKSTEGTETA